MFSLRPFSTVIIAAVIGATALPLAFADASAQVRSQAAINGREWTPERMRKAKPLPLPRGKLDLTPRAAPQRRGPSVSAPGYKPKEEPIVEEYPEPDRADDAPHAARNTAAPQSIGTAQLPFSVTRVFPPAAVRADPYRRNGKIFGHDPRKNADFTCSGAIFARRLVLTAGHCVYQPDGDYFYTQIVFVPGYDRNKRPFGTWTTRFILTTNAWANGNGTFPNAADFAILEINDRRVKRRNREGRRRKIGDYLGWLGYATNRLIGNHVTIIGYPGALDDGERMLQNNAQVVQAGQLAGAAGTTMAQGSSGGAWIEDFGVLADGQPTPNSSPNRIVGVVSFGPTPINPHFVVHSSIPGQAFLDLREQACARRRGNC